jgi:hypothetical protein
LMAKCQNLFIHCRPRGAVEAALQCRRCILLQLMLVPKAGKEGAEPSLCCQTVDFVGS